MNKYRNLRELSQQATSREQGFNILELLIGFTILSTMILGVAATVSSSQKSVHANEDVQTARHIAENEIERIRSLPFDQAIVPNTEMGGTQIFGPYGYQQFYYSYYFLDDLPGYSYCLTYYYLGEDLNPVMGDDIDMNGDGDSDDVLTPTDPYQILPVLVYIRWEPIPGKAQFYTQRAIISPKTGFMR